MFNYLFNKIPKSFWKTGVLVIIIFSAGPEMYAGMELMAFANLIGFDFFVLMYLAGLLLYLQPVTIAITNFWDKHFSLCEGSTIRQDLYFQCMNLHSVLVGNFIWFVMGVLMSIGSYWLIFDVLFYL